MRGKAIRRDGCIGLRRDHPRVCGEKYQLGVVKPLHEGSPPRMRGKAWADYRMKPNRGITPAYAGKSFRAAQHIGKAGDHPRVCGEKGFEVVCVLVHGGSPPRMRGKAWALTGSRACGRITPAYAGKSGTGPDTGPPGRDHPRVCGEKMQFNAGIVVNKGSPPRMRGKAGQCQYHRAEPGITPAYAGKSIPGFRLIFANGDHPRVCGEKASEGVTRNGIRGSPPRMRGKVTMNLYPHDIEGITPAYAGKSRRHRERRPCARDHPRVCGEKAPGSLKIVCRLGSPPRMRGKACFFGNFFPGDGITPAYAGKSRRSAGQVRRPRDHPRVCGEKGGCFPANWGRSGSPPRMRGKGSMSHCVLSLYGITPAYAGKSRN